MWRHLRNAWLNCTQTNSWWLPRTTMWSSHKCHDILQYFHVHIFIIMMIKATVWVTISIYFFFPLHLFFFCDHVKCINMVCSSTSNTLMMHTRRLYLSFPHIKINDDVKKHIVSYREENNITNSMYKMMNFIFIQIIFKQTTATTNIEDALFHPSHDFQKCRKKNLNFLAQA